jgi:hypothetical protein
MNRPAAGPPRGVVRLVLITLGVTAAALLCGQIPGRAAGSTPIARWIVSTRGLPHDGPIQEGADLEVRRCGPSGRWEASSMAEFLAEDNAAVETWIYVHGDRTETCEASAGGNRMWYGLTACVTPDRPIRFVIWSWPSAPVCRRLTDDVRLKARRAENQGWYLARFIDSMDPRVSVSVIGYSYGARLISAALEQLSGGSWGAAPPLARIHPDRPPMQVAFLAPAINSSGLGPVGRYPRALHSVERLTIVWNPQDVVLKRYWVVDGCRGQTAMGQTGLCLSGLPAEQWEKIRQWDASPWLGRAHASTAYMEEPDLLGRVTRDLLAPR